VTNPQKLKNKGLAILLSTLIVAVVFSGTVTRAGVLPSAFAADSSCNLHSAKDAIKHVIYIQFDNTHFVRDNPNFPSDLEQMPHLLNFITGQGTLDSNHHTPLISHTATDILTSLTGLYGDRMGVPVANSFRYFNPDGTSNVGVSFAYWTDPLYDPTTTTPTDTKYNMITPEGKNTPAPWVAYTRAGCNFGAVATANTVLENIATDIPTVFGANSTQAAEVKTNSSQAFADFVGIAVHCAQNSTMCSSANGGRPDILPDEQGGYSGFNGLFGHKYVAPQINNGSTAMRDLNGSVIKDSTGHIGFPGFDGMSAYVSLSYVAALQENGVPVTYAYISDAHDAHPSGPAFGPGQAGYVAALRSYDDAFAKFFARLESDGINKSNTLFVFTADEGDHFVGGKPTPANCDGVNIACTYSQIGEINTNFAGLLATQQNVTTPFKVHSDDAPTVYITGNPARGNTTARTFEKATAQLDAYNPITNRTETITRALADPVEMKLLHMVTSDAARTPTFTLFADPDYYLYAGSDNCSSPCVVENPSFAWNHGNFQKQITTTWLGMVGPGVAHKGVNGSTWSDHTDIRPTMMLLLGLRDDYGYDGRALVEFLDPSALPSSISSHMPEFVAVAKAYKEVNAPVGVFSLLSLKASTHALASNSQNDTTYNQIENSLSSLTSQRNDLKTTMIGLLQDSERGASSINPAQAAALTNNANDLIADMAELAYS
jgi:hypothetical protein